MQKVREFKLGYTQPKHVSLRPDLRETDSVAERAKERAKIIQMHREGVSVETIRRKMKFLSFKRLMKILGEHEVILSLWMTTQKSVAEISYALHIPIRKVANLVSGKKRNTAPQTVDISHLTDEELIKALRETGRSMFTLAIELGIAYANLCLLVGGQRMLSKRNRVKIREYLTIYQGGHDGTAE